MSMDNAAISRIATLDLEADVRALLDKHRDNDDVIFFLGRFVWQGDLKGCVPDLLEIARDASRGLYARIASIRAVMSVGNDDHKTAVLTALAEHPSPLDRRLLAEALRWAPPTASGVDLLLRAIDRLAPRKSYEVTGLGQALHAFIDRMKIMVDNAPEQPLARLAAGFNAFLDREPYVERAECHVSKAFTWLMGPALHAVDRLVHARARQALEPSAIAILIKAPALRFWRDDDTGEIRTSLGENIPRWREMNDALYWASIAARRAQLAEKGLRLVDDWANTWWGPLWRFGAEDFDRCLSWVSDRPNLDDRLVALSRSWIVYVTADRPPAWLERLVTAVAGTPELQAALDERLHPPPSPEREKFEAEQQECERQHEELRQKEDGDRADWIRELKADPDRIRKVSEFTGDHCYLLITLHNKSVSTNRSEEANWRALVDEFGVAVAEAYRDAAVAYWRGYQPSLRSEGADTNSTAYALIFAMAGLAIEAGEDGMFGAGLSEADARHAFRYVTWELNGFPRWFEPLYRTHPEIGYAAVQTELAWELENTDADKPMNYILHDILYHAPWLHRDMAAFLHAWLKDREMTNAENLRLSLNIITSGSISGGDLARLAAKKLGADTPAAQRPRWFAIWVDADPDAAIPALDAELEKLGANEASTFAQQFVVGLLGDRYGTGSQIAAFRTPAHLKTLYVLVHRYIRTAEDIKRANQGAYSPTLRDNAQHARDALFNLLAETPGAAAYGALKALELDHPEASYRKWMAVRARSRAIADADEPLWTPKQVRAFETRF